MNAPVPFQRRLKLFGHAAFERDGQSAALPLPAKALAILVILAANHERPVSREWLAERLWPDDEIVTARANLRRHLHLITKALGEDALELSRRSARWAPGSAVESDVIEFDRWFEESPERALMQYSGDLAEGLAEETVYDLRHAYAQRYVRGLQRLCARARESGDDAALLSALRRLTAEDRLDESVVRELMNVRRRMGDRAGALRDYNALEARLRSELDVQPEPATKELYDRILGASGDAAAPTNLPTPANTFVGREQELQSLSFSVRAHRLLTLLGSGGIGKTRLAVELARAQRRHFSDGVFFADLVLARDERDIYERIAAACGLRDRQDARGAVTDRLNGARTLVILDNCEHLFPFIERAARHLLEQTSAHIVATSRRRLGIDGETVHKIEPLPLPQPDAPPAELMRSAAVRLFVERGARLMPDLRVEHENARSIAEIVRRLDGLPLAVELVASRANLLTIDGIAKRLRDAAASFKGRSDDPRHRTIESATAWSYDLLSARERRVFDACGAFEGSFSLGALEAVLPDDLGDGFDELSELVESSLVHVQSAAGEYRYHLLETTREFARKNLDRNEDGSRIRAAFAHYYAAMLERIAPFAEGAREPEYYHPIDADYGNVRAALEYAFGTSLSLAASICATLYRYWTLRGHLEEGWTAVQACAGAKGFEGIAPELRGRFLQAAGIVARELGETGIAREYLLKALDICRSRADVRAEASTLWALGKLEYNVGNRDVCRTYYEQCLLLQRMLGDDIAAASTTANIGATWHEMNDLERARDYYEQALAEFQRLGYGRGLSYIHRQIALVQNNLGDHDSAILSARHSVAIAAEMDDKIQKADSLTILSSALNDTGRHEEALTSLVEALRLVSRTGHALFTMLACQALATTVQLLGRHADAARLQAFSRRMRDEKQLSLWTDYEETIAQELRGLQEALSPEAFAAATLTGESMTLADALKAAAVS